MNLALGRVFYVLLVGNTVGNYKNRQRKRATAYSAVTLPIAGGADETRTRDLRRDRPFFEIPPNPLPFYIILR